MQAASKLANAVRLMMAAISSNSPSFCRQRPNHLLTSSVVGYNDLDVGSCSSLHVVPELHRNSWLSTTPYCQVSEGFVSTGQNRPIRFNQHFQRST